MKEIKLTQGKIALIDNSHYQLVSNFKWFYCLISKDKNKKCEYAATKSINRKMIYLHRLIMSAKDGQLVDHINGNGLDCRENNMRICSRKQNNENRRISKNNVSGFKGVCFDKSAKKYRAYIQNENKKIHLGFFMKKDDAAKTYDEWARKLFGEFASTNFPLVHI